MKVNVSGPCLRASESYKYFGKGKGVVIYSHLDEAGQLTFSTVFSADEPESAHLWSASKSMGQAHLYFKGISSRLFIESHLLSG